MSNSFVELLNYNMFTFYCFAHLYHIHVWLNFYLPKFGSWLPLLYHYRTFVHEIAHINTMIHGLVFCSLQADVAALDEIQHRNFFGREASPRYINLFFWKLGFFDMEALTSILITYEYIFFNKRGWCNSLVIRYPSETIHINMQCIWNNANEFSSCLSSV
jgi:hypothetical protein